MTWEKWMQPPVFEDEKPVPKPVAKNPLDGFNDDFKPDVTLYSKVVKANLEAAEAVEKGEVVLGGTK